MVTNKGIQRSNPRAGSVDGNDRRSVSSALRSSGSRASGQSLDDLVINPKGLALAQDGRHAAAQEAPTATESKTVHEHAASGPYTQVFRRIHLLDMLAGLKIKVPIRGLVTWTSAAIMLSLAVAGVIFYMTWWDCYRVETKLLLFDRDYNPDNFADKALEEEVEILKSPRILRLVSREEYSRRHHPLRSSGSLHALETDPIKGLSSFEGAEALEKWLTRRTCLTSEISGGTAKVAIQMRGDDPALLRSLLDAYVCRYVDYRRALEAQSRNELQQAWREQRNPAEMKEAEAISAQLQKIEFQQRSSQLALQLIDSGKGVFSGFVPDQGLTGVPSLTHFQDKIVQLEIKKRALATQYMPSSREIVLVDLEIQGVRSAMRECLAEHLQFLKTERKQLVDESNKLNHSRGHTAGLNRDLKKEPCSGQSGWGDSWLVLRDGLHVLREPSIIARQPMLVRTSDFANQLIAYLAPSLARTAVSESNRNRDSSGPVGFSADGRIFKSGGTVQSVPTQPLTQPGKTISPVWQRAATSSSNAQRQHTGPANTRPRQ
jgi:hypothetical protein